MVSFYRPAVFPWSRASERRFRRRLDKQDYTPCRECTEVVLAAVAVDCTVARRPRRGAWAPRCCGRLSSPIPRSWSRRHPRRKRHRQHRRCRYRKSCPENPDCSSGPSPSRHPDRHPPRNPVANLGTPTREHHLLNRRESDERGTFGYLYRCEFPNEQLKQSLGTFSYQTVKLSSVTS